LLIAVLPRVPRRSARRRAITFALTALAGILPASALTPVANFDLDRYYGNWYEIAAIRGFLRSRESLKAATAALAQEGFDLCAFVFTPQACGRSDAGRLCDAR
jgi:lipocalin